MWIRARGRSHPRRNERILADVDALAVKGMRVLALARRELEGVLPETARETEVDMEFLGLVGMADPVRPEVPDAVAIAPAGRDPRS